MTLASAEGSRRHVVVAAMDWAGNIEEIYKRLQNNGYAFQ